MTSKTRLSTLGLLLFTAIVSASFAACGGSGSGEGGSGEGGSGQGGSGQGAGAPSTGSSSSGSYSCCINDAKYRCPDEAAFVQCMGFDIDACMQGCDPSDFACTDDCFDQWASSTPNPSACTADASVQCSGGGTTSTSSGPGTCVGEWTGDNCDYDNDCSTDNCTNHKCYGNDPGNPCEYDNDCNTDNCYQGCCYGNAKGDPCEYDNDCSSDNCYDHVCQ